MSKEENIVYVGGKPVMNYVLAVLTTFYRPDVNEVTLKARGNAVSHAVDVAEIVRRKFLEGVEVGEIKLGSEEMPARGENRTRMVSTIEITLKRSKP